MSNAGERSFRVGLKSGVSNKVVTSESEESNFSPTIEVRQCNLSKFKLDFDRKAG